jgi:hypothetical protein
MTKREFLDIVFALAPNEANKIMDAFDEYVESNEPHWIPVTERPPEVGKSVLICDAYGDICLGHRTSSGYYFPDFCEDKIKDVRAWAELPEPYKGVTT